jgi:hypothetical protein
MGNSCGGVEVNEIPEVKVKKQTKTKTKVKQQKKPERRMVKGANMMTEEPTYDETHLKNLLPNGATIKDSMNNEYNLDLMKQARRHAVEYEGWLNEMDWEEFTDKDGIVVYTCPNKSDSEVLLRRDASVNAPLDTCVRVLLDLFSLKAANDRIQYLEELEKIGTG